MEVNTMKPVIGICVSYASYLPHQLAITNRDWNLIASDYVYAIEKAGGTPLLLPITDKPESVFPLLSLIDGIVFTGGEDVDPHYYKQNPSHELGELNPKRDTHEFAIFKEVFDNTKLPILGVCRGHQLINVALGGSLLQDIGKTKQLTFEHSTRSGAKNHPVHLAIVETNSTWHQMLQQKELRVNSFHHQAIGRLGDNLNASILSSDGIIEGIEYADKSRFVAGIQWHPEMMLDHAIMQQLFTSFVNKTRH